RWTLKSDQRLIQSISLPVGLRLPPITCMTREPEKNFVATNVLGPLICITAARAGRANQGESQRLVIRFVGRVLTISQNRRAVGAILVREIDPLMRGDFELALFFIG